MGDDLILFARKAGVARNCPKRTVALNTSC